MKGHRRSLLRREAAESGGQIEVFALLLARGLEASQEGVKEAVAAHGSHGHADRHAAHPGVGSLVVRDLGPVQVKLGERVLRDVLGGVSIVEYQVGRAGHRGKLRAKESRVVDRRLRGRCVGALIHRSPQCAQALRAMTRDIIEKTGTGTTDGLPVLCSSAQHAH